MKFGNRYIRFAAALAIVGTVSAQIPMAGGAAFAQSAARDGYIPGGGGSGSRNLIQGAVLLLVGYGVYSTVSNRGGNIPPPPPADGTVTPVPADNGSANLKSIWDTLNGSDDFSTVAKVSDGADLKDKLRDPGPYTIFAPTNAAFSAIPADTLASLQTPEKKSDLQALLGYHVVVGKFSIAELKAKPDGTTLPTVSGGTVTITNTNGLKVNGIPVVESDIAASNGWIHPIGTVLTPPAP